MPQVRAPTGENGGEHTVTENRDDAADIPIDAAELSVFLRKQDAHTNGGSNGADNGTGPRL